MRTIKDWRVLLSLPALMALLASTATAEPAPPLERLRLPPGFAVELFARVPAAREIEVAPDGRAIVVSTREDKLFLIRDPDGNRRADEVVLLADGLPAPHGIALSADGTWLYLAQIDRLRSLENWDRAEGRVPVARDLFTGLPDKRWHALRSLALGPDGRLYLSIGSPCNICRPEGLEGTIVALDSDGRNLEVYASGIRNSVGFDWHPTTGELFFTDNGGDDLGDLIPPEEINRAPRPGLHFGFPFVWGSAGEPYPGFQMARRPEALESPAVELEAHAAPLGLHFYRGTQFPEGYRGSALVALHGSWNRDPDDPSGYQVVRVAFDAAGDPAGVETFIDGWLDQAKRAWGRPVHFAELPDGSLLISDDFAGILYRVTYRP